MIVAVEGIECAGKTTLCAALLDALGPERACVFRFPDRTTPIGKLIDAFLRVEEIDDEKKMSEETQARIMQQLFSANRREIQDQITDALSQGKIVILDRYIGSALAYGVGVHGFKPDWCEACDDGLTAPDLTLYIRLDPSVAMERKVAVRETSERYDDLCVLHSVTAEYDRLHRMSKDKEMQDVHPSVAGPWVAIDGSNDRDEVLRIARHTIACHELV